MTGLHLVRTEEDDALVRGLASRVNTRSACPGIFLSSTSLRCCCTKFRASLLPLLSLLRQSTASNCNSSFLKSRFPFFIDDPEEGFEEEEELFFSLRGRSVSPICQEAPSLSSCVERALSLPPSAPEVSDNGFQRVGKCQIGRRTHTAGKGRKWGLGKN